MVSGLDKAKQGFQKQIQQAPIIKEVEKGTPVKEPRVSPGPKIDTSPASPEAKFEAFIETKPQLSQQLGIADNPPPPIVTYHEENIKPGQNIIVEYETDKGTNKVIYKASNFEKNVTELENMGYRVVSAKSEGNKPFYIAETTSGYQSRVMDYYKKKYEKHGYIPYSYRKQMPKETIPEDVRDLGLTNLYVKSGYEEYLGLPKDSMAEFYKQYEKKSFESQTQEWAEKNLTFEGGKTFKQMKQEDPALYLEKGAKSWNVKYDVQRWQTERDAMYGGNPLYEYYKFTTNILAPERIQMAREQLFGKEMTAEESLSYKKDFVKYYQNESDKYLAQSHYEYAKMTKNKDYLGIAGRIVSSPLPSAVLTYYLTKGYGALQYSGFGSKALFHVGKFPVTRSTIITGATSSPLIVSAGMGVAESAKQGTLKDTLGNIAFTMPYQYYAGKFGYESGIISSERLNAGINKAQQSITNIKPTIETKLPVTKPFFNYMSQVKTKITTEDLFFARRHTPKFIKTYFSSASPKSIQSKIKQYQFSRASKTYKKDVGYYGQELYPYAVKNKLVKDVGRYKESEIRTPYEYYSAGTWIRPEEIEFMPHKLPDTQTYIIGLDKGPKTLTYAKDKSSYSISGFKPLKDNQLYVYGKTFSRDTSVPELFHGIIKSEETFMNRNLPSDVSAMKTIGSFKVKPGTLKNKFIEYPSGEFSHGGRLFDESFQTESISFTKKIGGSTRVPTKYGLSTIDYPEIDYSISWNRIIGRNEPVTKDISIVWPREIKKVSESKGFDIKGLDKITKTKMEDNLSLSNVTTGSWIERPTYPKLFTKQEPLSRYSFYTDELETGMIISDYWKTSIPKTYTRTLTNQKIGSIPATIVGSLPTIKTGININQLQNSLNKQIQNNITMPSIKVGSMPLNKQIQSQSQLQQSMQSQKTIQLQQAMQRQIQIQIPRTVTITSPIVTPKIITPKTPSPPIIPKTEEPFDMVGLNKRFKNLLGTGYRERTWKVPKLEDLLGG